MSKTELEKLLQDAERSHLWGNIQLDFQDGKLVLIRTTTTQKIREESNRDDSRN